MDANKNIDLDNPLCQNESKIMANVLQNHPLRFSIAASSSVPWIYLGKFWHTLKEDASKYMLKFVLDRKEIIMTLDEFRTIFQLPQATNNNHTHTMGHYMTANPKISRRVYDKYGNLEHDVMVKSIFNSRKNKARVGMNIPSWMITDEMKLTKNYQIYTAVFGVDVPTTQSQPIESTHRTHKITSTPRLDPESHKESLEVEKTVVERPMNVIKEEDESAKDDYEVKRRVKGKNVEKSRHTPSPTPIRSPMIHSTLISLDTKKLHELTITDITLSSSTPSSSSPKPTLSMSQHILSLFKPKTRRFKQYKSFLDELQGCYNYLFGHLKTRFLARKKFNVLGQHLQEVMEESLLNMVDDHVDSSVKSYMSNHILHVHPTQANQASIQEQQYQLYLTMKDNPQLQHDDLPIWLAHKIKFQGLTASNTPCRSFFILPRDQDDPHDYAHPERENSAKRQKKYEHGTYVFGESLYGQANQTELGPPTSGNQEQLDDFDFWTDTYATDDDEFQLRKYFKNLWKKCQK
nr:hypothetical protein [Tanacetum cinerariifolium]